MSVLYARCPHCRTVFRVDPQELPPPPGLMRCGNCLRAFEARAHLSEELPAPPPVIETEPAEPSAATGDDASPPTATDTVFQPAGASGEEEEVPAALRQDAGRRRQIGASALLLSLLLVGLLAFQLVLFNPAAAVGLAPPLAPAVQSLMPLREGLLAAIGRPRPAFRNVTAIGLLSRDVRNHPEIPEALLVRAVMVNRAALAQPFPTLELTLFDVNGATLASRRFRPAEYLDDPQPGPMAPDQPVQFSLRLIAPPMAAVSYEFRFH